VEVFDSTAEGSVDDKFLDDFPADLEAQEILLRLSEDALLPAPPQGHVFSVLLTPAGKKYRRTDKVPNCTKVKIATRPLPPVAAPMLAGQTTILTQTAHTCQNLMLLLTHLSSFISCLRSLYHHIESRPMRLPVILLSPLFLLVPLHVCSISPQLQQVSAMCCHEYARRVSSLLRICMYGQPPKRND
jgi:hypothetical protein